MDKIVTFKQFGQDFKNYYRCDKVSIKNDVEAEIVMSDLYNCEDYEFNYDRRVIELYY